MRQDRQAGAGGNRPERARTGQARALPPPWPLALNPAPRELRCSTVHPGTTPASPAEPPLRRSRWVQPSSNQKDYLYCTRCSKYMFVYVWPLARARPPSRVERGRGRRRRGPPVVGTARLAARSSGAPGLCAAWARVLKASSDLHHSSVYAIMVTMLSRLAPLRIVFRFCPPVRFRDQASGPALPAAPPTTLAALRSGRRDDRPERGGNWAGRPAER